MIGENAAGTGTVMRAGTIRMHAEEAGFGLPGAGDRQRLLSLLPALSGGPPRRSRSASARFAHSSRPHLFTASDQTAPGCGGHRALATQQRASRPCRRECRMSRDPEASRPRVPLARTSGVRPRHTTPRHQRHPPMTDLSLLCMRAARDPSTAPDWRFRVVSSVPGDACLSSRGALAQRQSIANQPPPIGTGRRRPPAAARRLGVAARLVPRPDSKSSPLNWRRRFGSSPRL